MYKMRLGILVFVLHFGPLCAMTRFGIREKILENYDPDVYPGELTNEPVTVSFELKMQTFDGFDIRNQALTLNAFNVLKWNDSELRWNASEFNNVDTISMSSDLIWTPDVVLYNTALKSSLSHLEIYKSKVKVKNSGECIWSARATWTVSCSSDVTWFPVDTQECLLSFGSFSYTRSNLIVTFNNKPDDRSSIESDVHYVDNGQWEILSLSSNAKDIFFSCCKEPFSVIEYKIKMKRLYKYYFLYILLPLISLSVVFLLIFHIPPHVGERMGFGVTILLSITVYLLVISEKLPEKSDSTPMLGVSFIYVFYILCLALAVAAMTMTLSFRTEKPPLLLLKMICKKKNSGKSADGIGNQEPNENDGDATIVNKLENNMTVNVAKDYSEEWRKISRYLDKRLFVIFFLLLFTIPIFIAFGL